MNKALIVVDMQKDFVSGSLAVPGAMSIVPFVNEMIDNYIDEWNRDLGRSESAGVPIYYSMDWHAPDHESFTPYGGRWPVHCVAGTGGAAIIDEVPIVPGSKLILKGQTYECYSAMGGVIGASLTPHSAFSLRGIKEVDIVGLALDFCVMNTAVDAARLGYKVRVHRAGTVPVFASNVPGTEAIFREEGIEFV